MSDDMASTGGVERITLLTSDGVALEAEYARSGAARCSVVVCHPHPLYGGSMHANVVQALFAALPDDGASVLRFNFRGSGASGGEHDNGRAERLDVTAALEEVVRREPERPVLLAGYSFGADVALASDHPALVGWFAVAPPLRVVDPADMTALVDPRPTFVVTGAHDQFRPPTDAAEILDAGTNNTITSIEGADHFFGVGLPAVVTAALHAIDRILS